MEYEEGKYYVLILNGLDENIYQVLNGKFSAIGDDEPWGTQYVDEVIAGPFTIQDIIENL